MFYEIILFGAKSLKKIKKALIKLAPFLLLFTPPFASPEHVNEQNYAVKSWFIFVKIFLAQVWCNYYIVVYSKWKKARFGFSFCEGCKPRHCIIRVITPKLSDQTLEFGNQNLIIWEHEILILNDIFLLEDLSTPPHVCCTNHYNDYTIFHILYVIKRRYCKKHFDNYGKNDKILFAVLVIKHFGSN